jgi:hypothetical protein
MHRQQEKWNDGRLWHNLQTTLPCQYTKRLTDTLPPSHTSPHFNAAPSASHEQVVLSKSLVPEFEAYLKRYEPPVEVTDAGDGTHTCTFTPAQVRHSDICLTLRLRLPRCGSAFAPAPASVRVFASASAFTLAALSAPPSPPPSPLPLPSLTLPSQTRYNIPHGRRHDAPPPPRFLPHHSSRRILPPHPSPPHPNPPLYRLASTRSK